MRHSSHLIPFHLEETYRDSGYSVHPYTTAFSIGVLRFMYAFIVSIFLRVCGLELFYSRFHNRWDMTMSQNPVEIGAVYFHCEIEIEPEFLYPYIAYTLYASVSIRVLVRCSI